MSEEKYQTTVIFFKFFNKQIQTILFIFSLLDLLGSSTVLQLIVLILQQTTKALKNAQSSIVRVKVGWDSWIDFRSSN